MEDTCDSDGSPMVSMQLRTKGRVGAQRLRVTVSNKERSREAPVGTHCEGVAQCAEGPCPAKGNPFSFFVCSLWTSTSVAEKQARVGRPPPEHAQ